MHSISHNDSDTCEPTAMGEHTASVPSDGSDELAVSALEAANAALLALRKRLGIVTRETQEEPETEDSETEDVALGQHFELPPDFGWGSEAVTEQIKRWRARVSGQETSSPLEVATPSKPTEKTEIAPLVSESSPEVEEEKTPKNTIVAHPDLLFAFLRDELVTVGRVWLLCRLLDAAGRGWLDVEAIREALTGKESPLKVCGWRRLRQILAEGKGIFWERDDQGRLWLYSQVRVSTALGIDYFQHNPVLLTVEQLTEKIGQVKAHFYAAFHSSRVHSEKANPISRETLTELTGLSARTQQRYDEQVGIGKQQMVGVGLPFSDDRNREHLWKGKSTFKFIDKKGKLGPAGATYVAWHLPNQYGAIHQSAPVNQRRRLNKKLAAYTSSGNKMHDLAIQRAQGNDADTLFFADGRAASKKMGNGGYLKANGQKSIWYAIGGI